MQYGRVAAQLNLRDKQYVALTASERRYYMTSLSSETARDRTR
jgi:hypothetical protein